MRKHVKPAHPQAVIPDPVRRRDLPPAGYPVTWSTHWARLAARGDIIVTELPEAGAETPPPALEDAQREPGGHQDAPEPEPAGGSPAEAEETAHEHEDHPDA